MPEASEVPTSGRNLPATVSRARGAWVLLAAGGLVVTALTPLAITSMSLGPDIGVLDWVGQSRVLLVISNEAMAFATAFLGAATYFLSRFTHDVSPSLASIGAGSFALAAVCLAVATLAVGRLIYPVLDLPIPADITQSMAPLAFAAVHMATIGLAGGIICFSAAQRRSITVFGLAVASILLVGTYYATSISLWLHLVSLAGLLAWFAVMWHACKRTTAVGD